MKFFALALLTATVSAELTSLLNFSEYFTRVEARPVKPKLGSYTYGYDYYLTGDWSEYGFEATAAGDFNVEYNTPFTNDATHYSLSFVPEINAGG